jgi:transposase-like protein
MRKRGRQPFFDDGKLKALANYLRRPGSTIAEAAELFGCSASCVEKTLARARKVDGQKEAPAPREGTGHVSPEAGAPWAAPHLFTQGDAIKGDASPTPAA